MEMSIKREEANEEIMELQPVLVPLIHGMRREIRPEGRICFTTDYAKSSPDGNSWILKKAVPGRDLKNYFDSNPEWVVETSKKIVDDYQKVIARYFEQNPTERGNLLEDGRKWLFGNLLKWSGPIVEEGLISHLEIRELLDDFESLVRGKGEDLFGYAHGNVIGDHIYVGENKTLYLLGMRIVPRPGKGYYDFLRALDWLFLKMPNEEENFKRIVGWMKKYIAEYNWEEVQFVFALRCVGILGWDMLHRGDFGEGNIQKKKEFLLRFIRREY